MEQMLMNEESTKPNGVYMLESTAVKAEMLYKRILRATISENKEELSTSNSHSSLPQSQPCIKPVAKPKTRHRKKRKIS